MMAHLTFLFVFTAGAIVFGAIVYIFFARKEMSWSKPRAHSAKQTASTPVSRAAELAKAQNTIIYQGIASMLVSKLADVSSSAEATDVVRTRALRVTAVSARIHQKGKANALSFRDHDDADMRQIQKKLPDMLSRAQ